MSILLVLDHKPRELKKISVSDHGQEKKSLLLLTPRPLL